MFTPSVHVDATVEDFGFVQNPLLLMILMVQFNELKSRHSFLESTVVNSDEWCENILRYPKITDNASLYWIKNVIVLN